MVIIYFVFFPEVYTSSIFWNRYNKYYLIRNKLFTIGFIDYQIEYKIKVYFIKIPFVDKLFSFQINPFGNFRIYDKSDFQHIYKMFGVE